VRFTQQYANIAKTLFSGWLIRISSRVIYRVFFDIDRPLIDLVVMLWNNFATIAFLYFHYFIMNWYSVRIFKKNVKFTHFEHKSINTLNILTFIKTAKHVTNIIIIMTRAIEQLLSILCFSHVWREQTKENY
jgi:hypothetical protein